MKDKKDKKELLHFMRLWKLDDKLLWKDSAWNQCIFVRDTICGNLLKVHGFVVSSHYSKSCKLPVYFFTMRNGVKIIMRDNFYDWKVSIETPITQPPLPAHFIPEDCLSYSMVKNKLDKIHECYLEGFLEEWCYDAYNPEKPARKFTIEVPSKYLLFIIIHKLKHIYPEVDVMQTPDNRSKEDIKKVIDDILANNGNSEFEPSRWNPEKSNPIMPVYEILWRTYLKIDDLKHDEHYNKTPVWDEFPSVCDEPQLYAEMIMKYPEVHEEFLREEMMYNSEP